MRYIQIRCYRVGSRWIAFAVFSWSLVAFSGATRPAGAQPADSLTAQEAKSPSAAFALSFLGTFLPAAAGYGLASTGSISGAELLVFSFGVFAGPGLGHIYAGNSDRAIRGAALRGGILLTTTVVLSLTGICLESCEPDEELVSAIFALSGMAGMMISAIADMSSAPGAARRFNREHGLVLGVRPWILPASGRVGVRAELRF